MTPEKWTKIQRAKIIDKARSYLGAKQGGGKHKHIVNLFNEVKPDGWAMTYSAYWCATFASAIAIEVFGKEKAKKFFPLSANCQTIVSKAKKMGIWKENDAYKPEAGDWILYDWQDSGKGNNVGGPDHVGIVEETKNGKIRVIEGNKNKAVGERTVYIDGKYIRGFVVPKYDEIKKHSRRWYFIKTFQEIQKYMRAHKFKYEPSWTENALNWADAKKKKTSNCSTYVCYSLQESDNFEPGMYFWINGDAINYRGKGTKKRLEKIATITHPHKPPQKCHLRKGDIVGYKNNPHTMIFYGWDSKDRPTWFSFGSSDVGKKEPRVKASYNDKKIMTLIRIKRGADKK